VIAQGEPSQNIKAGGVQQLQTKEMDQEHIGT